MLKIAHLPDLLLEQPSFRVRQEVGGHGAVAGDRVSVPVERRTGLSSYCESFNSRLRDEFLNGEVNYSLKVLRLLAERWRFH